MFLPKGRDLSEPVDTKDRSVVAAFSLDERLCTRADRPDADLARESGGVMNEEIDDGADWIQQEQCLERQWHEEQEKTE